MHRGKDRPLQQIFLSIAHGGFSGGDVRFQVGEVEERTIQEQRGRDVPKGGEHAVVGAGKTLIPVLQHLLDLFAFQILLRAAQVAGDDRKLEQGGIMGQVGLLHIGQRSNHHMAAALGTQLRRHRLHLAGEEQIQQQGFENVVAMVP
ncbi:MAG: hypothetical protein LZF60_160066 [Nitrospira sp.]|nr:MAG: hypothetical protein LZF60_160066 [Nitrospira sp.]